MNKEVTMTFRVESDLRSRFTAAAELEHRPAAQVLREFMREYVERIHIKGAVPVDVIPDPERSRREKAVNFANASIGLEGFKVSKEDEALARNFINGEIGIADILEAAREQARKR
jgi:hypothetical protein